MLKTRLLHPEILKALASSGHFCRVLIADGNFPVAAKAPPQATKVFLNLCPGTVKATEILEVLLDFIVVQEAAVMQYPENENITIQDEFRKMLPESVEIKKLERSAFYEAVSSPDTTLVIASGDTRRFGNILLTIGVVKY
jgi:L-fucose mutarotase